MSRSRRRLLAAVALMLVAIVAIAYIVEKGRTGNISNRNVEFDAAHPKARPAAPADRFSWPLYGLTPDHLRDLDVRIRPPYRRRWVFRAAGLLEFPPVIARGILYQLNGNAVLNAVDKETGALRWSRHIGLLSASTPAVGSGAVFATVLRRAGGGGRVIALSPKDGHVIWRRNLPSGSESSPLLSQGTVYFGSQDGTIYALGARDGALRWTFRASGSVKASPTLRDGILYFGAYGGDVRAISARTGRLIWSAGTSGAVLGSGSFYATAAVAFGRVYVGNTDGRMYSFSARTGKLAWAHQTGNYVYASAAMLDTPGLGPTAYVGSYDGTFYAFDARTGDVRWRYNAHGKISGSATIIGRIVYFANLATHDTIGLDVRTGRRVFKYPTGGFDPVISDGKRIYLTGFNAILALDPISAPPR
ncbi:MAG: hypothetical protein NVS2B6_10770 [Thermoleophilaceae bacterium]